MADFQLGASNAACRIRCVGFCAECMQYLLRIACLLTLYLYLERGRKLRKFTFKYEPTLSNRYAYMLRLGQHVGDTTLAAAGRHHAPADAHFLLGNPAIDAGADLGHEAVVVGLTPHGPRTTLKLLFCYDCNWTGLAVTLIGQKNNRLLSS